MQDWLDGRHDPIWIQTFPSTYSDAELDHAFDALDALIARMAPSGRYLYMISDVSTVRVGNAVHRRRIAKSFAHTARRMGGKVGGQAFVLRSRVQRGALTATLWLSHPPWPIEVCGTMDEAMAWMRARRALTER